MTKPGARVSFLLALLTMALVLPAPAHAVTPATGYQPDGWIKLCGWGDTCENAPPHAFRGNNVYNGNGSHQTASVSMQDGTDVRFWILLQNDGTPDDTLTVQGCVGNRTWVVRVVNIGWYKKASWAPIITKRWKAGTATFHPDAEPHHRIQITLDIWAHTDSEVAQYTCRIVVTSSGDPSARDVLVAKMHT
jgi:hypothetical protein